MTASIRIGLSGWRYPHWRGGAFYPSGLVQRRELEYVSRVFDTLELNGPSYSLQRPSSFARWRDTTPDGFVFAVKGSRFITHLKKLAGIDEALAAFFASGLLDLGDKLGPVLWQLPPMLGYRPDRMAAFLGALPRTWGAATGLAGGIGYTVASVAVNLGLAAPVATALACVVIGSLGRVWALHRRASPMAVVIPATTMLLPGLTIFRGLQAMTAGATRTWPPANIRDAWMACAPRMRSPDCGYSSTACSA